MPGLQDMSPDILVLILKQAGITCVGDVGRLTQVHRKIWVQFRPLQQLRERRLNYLVRWYASRCQSPFFRRVEIKQIWIDGGWNDMVALFGDPPLVIAMTPLVQWWKRQKAWFRRTQDEEERSVDVVLDLDLTSMRECVKTLNNRHTWPGEFLVDRLNYGIERGEGRMPEGYVTPRNPRTV